MTMRMAVRVVVSVSWILASSACGDLPKPGDKGSASGAYSAAFVNAGNGSLQVVLSDGDAVCGSRAARQAFEGQGGLRILLVAVGTSDELERSPNATYGDTFVSFASSGERPLSAANQFAAAAVATGETRSDIWASPNATSGTVSLDDSPDYDSGAVSGSYDLVIDGNAYKGSFHTAFCPTEVAAADLRSLGLSLYDSCSLVPDVPFEPGSSLATLDRDLERGMRALAPFPDEMACAQAAIDRGACAADELNACLGFSAPT